MVSVTCKVPADWLSTPSDCWYDWQTLIAGLAAVLVGGVTVFYLRKQIYQADRLANEERGARLAVARAKLIVPSSDLARHAKACLKAVAAIAPAVLNRGTQAAAIDLPPLPPSIETALDALLANTRDRTTSFLISAVYGEQQVLAARVSELHVNPRSHAVSFDSYCIQPVIMRAIAIKLLLYARSEVRHVGTIGWADLKSSVERMGVAEPVRERLLAYIDDKFSRSKRLPFAVKAEDG